MSSSSSTAIESRTLTSHSQEKTMSQSLVTYQSNSVAFGPTVSYTSSLIVHLKQLQTDLQAQYQHEKSTLSELNKQFRSFIDRVQSLESQNAKYIAQLADFRRQSPHSIDFDDRWDQSFLHLQNDLGKGFQVKIDSEFEAEFFQLQAALYRQLIENEQQTINEKKIQLEQHFKQTSNELNSLRISFSEMDNEINRLEATRGEMINKYLHLAQDWTQMKRQIKEWQFNINLMKNYVAFYKRISSSTSGRKFDSTVVSSVDTKEFWSVEFDRAVKKIRRDFEILYGSLNENMKTYYINKEVELKKEVEQIRFYQQSEYEEFVVVQEKLQIEYEKIQQSFSYEREISSKLETKYVQLESEFKSIQMQNEERFEIQSKDMYSTQENLMSMAYDIDEIRRSKVNLEAEIIVYRHLLGLDEVQQPRLVIEPATPTNQTIRSEMIGKYIINTKKKGSIGIKECAPNGSFILLSNYSTSKDIDLSRWSILRRIDSSIEHRYLIPDGVRLQRGEEIRIYSKQGISAAESSSSNYRTISPQSRSTLVNRELTSWGMGNRVETFLFNQDGEEKAHHTQSIALERKNF